MDTAAKERELETRKEQVKPVPKEDDREERRTERASRPSQPEKAEVKSWRDAPKPEINTRSNGRKGSSTSQDEKSNGVKNSTTSQNSSAKASDQDASSDADGWQEASHKRVPNTRGGGARRGSGQRDRRDDRGSRNGRRERDEAESTKPNVVPADPPAKSAWGGSNKSARPAPVVKESKKVCRILMPPTFLTCSGLAVKSYPMYATPTVTLFETFLFRILVVVCGGGGGGGGGSYPETVIL